jgi:hypothetical protein
MPLAIMNDLPVVYVHGELQSIVFAVEMKHL